MRTTIPGALVIRGDHSWQAPCREKCKATPVLQFKTCLSTASRSQRRMKKSTICPISSVALHDIHPPTFLEQRTSSQILWRWVPSLHLGLSFACARWAAYSIAGPRSRPRKATWQAQALVASRHRHHSRAGGYLPGSARPRSTDLKRVCSETPPRSRLPLQPLTKHCMMTFAKSSRTAEAEGSASRPGSLLFIIQFPDWWFHKPAAKCCVLYCQQTNGLNGRQGE